jgi:predicted HicB family RNase H-like nuclease
MKNKPPTKRKLLAVQVPESLHALVKAKAAKDRISLREIVTRALLAYVRSGMPSG